MGSAYWGTCFMNYVSWPIILLITKYGDNLNAPIARQQLILMRNIDDGFFCLCYIYFWLRTVDFYILHCLLFFSSLSNTFFYSLSCVDTSRCLTGSATTKNCSCRVTQRSAWATNMPLTYRRSTITLPWIPWWVEGTLWTTSLCLWVRKGPAHEATFRERCGPVRSEVRKVRLGCGSSPLSGKQNVALSTQTLVHDYFLDLRAAQSCGVYLDFGEQIQYFLGFWHFFDWELMRAVGGTLII